MSKKDIIDLFENKKVFCNNCKFFESDEYGDVCNCNKNLSIYYNFKTKFIFHINTPQEKNENNNCINYKRKWYKFWIK